LSRLAGRAPGNSVRVDDGDGGRSRYQLLRKITRSVVELLQVKSIDHRSVDLLAVLAMLRSAVSDSAGCRCPSKAARTSSAGSPTGSAAASLSFLWVMHKEMRAQKLSPPRNTFVWLIFYELILLGEIADCFLVQISGIFSPASREIVILALLTYGMSVTAWCAIKLRSIRPEAPSEAASV